MSDTNERRGVSPEMIFMWVVGFGASALFMVYAVDTFIGIMKAPW
jgi:hypothetical protein